MQTIKIGTRKSELALKQANNVGASIEKLGGTYELVLIQSVGDIDLKTPLHEIGFTGVFTKALDMALLNGDIDIAVHSLKDVPTELPKGIVQAAVIKRDNPIDILVTKEALNLATKLTIATGSIRRKAQWLHKYPAHQIVGLRGNVHTRLQKLADSEWSGAIFSHSGLDRVDLIPVHHIELNWMTPAPAQGVVTISIAEANVALMPFIQQLNHAETALITQIERDFLNELEGGCSAPIGALASIEKDTVRFKGVLTAPDGKQQFEIEETIKMDQVVDFGRKCAQSILAKGGAEIMKELQN
ncbi:hydroxymethylbilane synthase [Putridiphycobacter roseus]|uniref:Hydroxymethylbilane synthase n=1 Tax=Putridiphycobacter roseus TaxID=2219161 RepID=A0A2W1N5D0_9FLAO|nr:hydroxymethylbilane synthase [Putridiphycobacter roseus]PZE18790.1 hydroxymethylbilane synthase [Putridiphycobacter roseus]